MKEQITVAHYIRRMERKLKRHGMKRPSLRVNRNIRIQNRKMKRTIKKHLQDYFMLLDFGISVMESIHNLFDAQQFTYKCITAKMTEQLLSMRILLYHGQMDSVKSIYRAFHEMMEIFFACLIDADFANSYGNLEEPYDNNEFWRTQINGNKLDKYIHKLFDEIGYTKDHKKAYFKRRDGSKLFLSETVHSSFNSASTAYIMTTIDGDISDALYGKITTAYPNGIYEILMDICIINTVVMAMYDSDKFNLFWKEKIRTTDISDYFYFSRGYDTMCNIYSQSLYERVEEILTQLQEIEKYCIEAARRADAEKVR